MIDEDRQKYVKNLYDYVSFLFDSSVDYEVIKNCLFYVNREFPVVLVEQDEFRIGKNTWSIEVDGTDGFILNEFDNYISAHVFCAGLGLQYRIVRVND